MTTSKAKRASAVAAALLSVGVLAAACGSSTPSATSKKTTTTTAGSTTTTVASGSTTTTAATSGSTTTTAAGKSTATTTGKSTATTSKSTATTAAAAAGAPGGSLGGSNDFNTPSASLSGAGSTFDQPLFASQFYHYNQDNPKVSVSYASVGSGTGEGDIEANTVNFGASDVPMQTADLAKASTCCGAVLQVPVVLGGIAMAYNLPGVSGGLKLSGAVLANIYEGNVTMWNDPSITALNPGVSLPAQTIVTVHRSDSSGTSNAFTHYLADVSSSWPSSVVGKGPFTWPGSNTLGGNGNAGVATDIQNTQYSIGYVELAYALQSGFTYCDIQNQAGNFIAPTLNSVSAAAAAFPGVTATNYLIVDPPSSAGSAYPISTYSWALLYQEQTNLDKGIAMGKLLDWMVNAGQSIASGIGYAPLPSNIVALAESTIHMMENSSGQALFNS